jgi:hypothetical protein
MFKKPYIFGERPIKVLRAFPRRRIFHITLALVLAFSMGSAGQSLPAYAAPLAESRVVFGISVSKPPNPICEGRDYNVAVKLTKYSEIGVDGVIWKPFIEAPLNATTVNASVKDPGIGTLTPSSLLTGWALGESGDSPGEAIFSFHAIKAGQTQLNFLAKILDYDKHGPLRETKDAMEPIKVVKCDYKVTMTYSVQQSGAGYFSMLYGKLDARLKREDNVFRGTGTLDTTRTASVSGCSFSSTGYKNPTTFTGTPVELPNGEELQLTIQYAAGSHSDNISCPYGSGGATESIDPTAYLETSATFPESGGTKSFPVDFAHWSGNLLITVTPVEAK